MADDVTPPDIRARRFDVARRGYDREQVDSYLAHLADEIDHLSGKLQDRKTNELKVGLDDPEALALELAAIGGEVSMVLEAARAAAEGMRGRATSDVEEWRTTTQEQTQVAMADATEQSQSMRASAWNEGSSMLASSLAEAKALVDSAREDALFIRAEAEREAIRLTGDAKRDREESLRSARMESDQMLEAARNESEGILAAAGQQADQAQERARALEDRRSELLAELESTRASISHLEEEIDSKRQELETPPPEPEPDLQQRSHHTTDGGSVRIVAPSKSVTLKPVDAEEFVADVVALRAGADAESGSEPDVTIVEPETVTVIAPPPPVEEPTEPEPTADIATDDERPTTNDEEPEPTSDDIGSLFASL
ncbi:MAG: DivIVA domain-containing protein, partial [Actinomycetota bacterium]